MTLLVITAKVTGSMSDKRVLSLLSLKWSKFEN